MADKTGYPQDMLDLELDLEADLGIDTVKQAETFAAIREAFDIPLQESLSLRDYPDAAKRGRLRLYVPARPCSRLRAGRRFGGARPAPAGRRCLGPMSRRRATNAGHAYSIEDANRIPRRAPVPVLRPATRLLQAETGVRLGAGTRVVVMLDEAACRQGARSPAARSWGHRPDAPARHRNGRAGRPG